MHSFDKLLFGAAIATLGGCILAYDYDAHDTTGVGGDAGSANGGSGGFGGTGGSTSSSSSSSGMGGAGGAGGAVACNVSICNDPSLENCNVGSCNTLDWTRRFGTLMALQEARAVTLDSAGNIIVGGAYSTDAFDMGGTMLPATGSLTGFVARLNVTGAVEMAKQTTAGAVLGIATDAMNDVIVAGYQVQGTEEFFLVQKRTIANSLNLAWGVSYGVSPVKTRALAVDTDANNNIYVAGTTSGNFSIDCPTATTISMGMFILKLGPDSTCQWVEEYSTAGIDNITPTALRVGNDMNVWVTGHFQAVLADSAGNQLKSTGGRDMFLLRHNVDTGVPGLPYGYGPGADNLGGTIAPADIDIDAQGNIFVAGTLQGQTVFDPTQVQGQISAFVTKIDSTTGVHFPFVLRASAGVGESAHATGVAMGGGKLFVSGMFAGKITVDATQPDVVAPLDGGVAQSNTAFLAVFDPVLLKLLSFEYFAGYGHQPGAGTVKVAAGQTSTVLAGGWSKSLDFANGMGGPNFLAQDPSSMATDVFIAKFSYDP